MFEQKLLVMMISISCTLLNSVTIRYQLINGTEKQFEFTPQTDKEIAYCNKKQDKNNEIIVKDSRKLLLDDGDGVNLLPTYFTLFIHNKDNNFSKLTEAVTEKNLKLERFQQFHIATFNYALEITNFIFGISPIEEGSLSLTKESRAFKNLINFVAKYLIISLEQWNQTDSTYNLLENYDSSVTRFEKQQGIGIINYLLQEAINNLRQKAQTENIRSYLSNYQITNKTNLQNFFSDPMISSLLNITTKINIVQKIDRAQEAAKLKERTLAVLKKLKETVSFFEFFKFIFITFFMQLIPFRS